jgi:DNA-binding transcriptional regulator YdaS (Cro superfamily)
MPRMEAISRAIEAAGGPSKVARQLRVTAQAVCFWRTGKRQFPAEHAAALESISGVRRWEIFPTSWHAIWPELIGTEGAPPVPGPDAAAPAAPPAGTAARPRIDWPALAGTEGAPPGADAAAPPPPADWPTCVRRTERHDGPTTEATHAA